MRPFVQHVETVQARTRFNDFGGKSVYHCHVFDHEDLGMMGNILLKPEHCDTRTIDQAPPQGSQLFNIVLISVSSTFNSSMRS